MRRLIIRPGAIGDVIVSLPALESLKAGYTEVWTTAATAPLIGFADHVRALSSTPIDLVELGLASPGIFRGFDDIVSWYASNRMEFRRAVAAYPFRFFPALPPDQSRKHAADFYLAQVGAPLGAAPRMDVPRHSGGYLALHPYSGSARKNWPLENFRTLAARVPFEWCHERFESLLDLAHWLAGARLYLGNDSGIAHLAAAVGTPVIALFGPTDPAVWAPRPSRVLHRDPITAITVEEVERAVIDCLECASSSPS